MIPRSLWGSCGNRVPRVSQCSQPLPDRNLGQHPVDEVGRRVGHAATATGRTEAAALAREGDEPVAAAGVAVHADESMSQHAALEVRADLALDETGDGGALRSRTSEEGDELRADDLVEKRLLRLMASVFSDDDASAGTRTWRRRITSRVLRLAACCASRVFASTRGCPGETRRARSGPSRSTPRCRFQQAPPNTGIDFGSIAARNPPSM